MKVELISHTPDIVGAIESAASNCYDSKPTDGKTMDKCYESGHLSVFEFAQFQFKISGISRACSHQLVRYRTASFAQRSQRYVKEESFRYVTPPSIKKDFAADLFYNMAMGKIEELYNNLINHYNIPPEDARYILPNACTTTLEMSIDLRNFIHMCNERLCSRAQWEIRGVVQEMVRLVVEVEPKLKKYLVPKCEIHSNILFCTEEKSCGKHPRLNDCYGIISKVPIFSVPVYDDSKSVKETNKNSTVESHQKQIENKSSPEKNKNFIVLIGKSGSGKTTVLNYLRDHYGMKPVVSYTTRKPRYEGEDNHTFVSLDDFIKMNFAASTYYDGNCYGTTAEQIEENDIGTFDPAGADNLHKKYKGKKKLIDVYLDVPDDELRRRMLSRGDDIIKIAERELLEIGCFTAAKSKANFRVVNKDIKTAAEAIYNIWKGKI